MLLFHLREDCIHFHIRPVNAEMKVASNRANECVHLRQFQPFET